MSVALAASRYRLAHGRLPDRIEDLVPEYLPAVPRDPFDGLPLRYRRTDEGAIIYSVGPDGVDNGGTAPGPKVSWQAPGTDVVLEVER